MNAANLTDLEVETLQLIVDSDYQDGRDPVNNYVWSFSVTGKGPKARQIKGALSSLSKKGFADFSDYDGEATVAITHEGMAVLTAAKAA